MHAFEPTPVPLAETADGVIRVAGTRVTLDSVVASYDTGATAEEIAPQYPTLPLDAIYAVITWVLKHRPEVDVYLARRHVESEAVRAEVEKRHPPEGIRERLLARRR